MAPPAEVPENAIFMIEAAEKQTVYYACQSGDKLTEEIFSGDPEVPISVGSAKAGTNGAYVLLSDDERAIYCLKEGDTLQDFKFDCDEWEWNEGELVQLKIPAAPNTNIATIKSHNDNIEVFFQGLSGEIQSVRRNGDQSWRLSHNLPATNPLPGASICAVEINGITHLFYGHRDYSIHALVLDGEKWSDITIPFTAGGSPKSDIFVQPRDGDYKLQFCDADGGVFVIADGETTEIGQVTSDGFKKKKDAQADRWPEEVQTSIKWKGLK